jgi:hypothetical protein
VENLLKQHGIAFQVLCHEPVYTSEEVMEMTGLAPGSIPPFGSLFGLPTLCDERLGVETMTRPSCLLPGRRRFADHRQDMRPHRGRRPRPALRDFLQVGLERITDCTGFCTALTAGTLFSPRFRRGVRVLLRVLERP